MYLCRIFQKTVSLNAIRAAQSKDLYMLGALQPPRLVFGRDKPYNGPMESGNPFRLLRGAVVASICATISACSTSLVVNADFPVPLVDPLPVRVGFLFDETFSTYVHEEKIPQQASYSIQIGDANVSLLSQLFASMFVAAEPVVTLPLESAGQGRLDAVIKPELERFEFDVPIQRTDQFVEVWMQYQMRLYETDGQLIAEWPVTGYGKAEHGNRGAALNRAAVVAMREVGAEISTEFSAQPAVEYWLEEKQNESALSSEAGRNN